MDQKKGKTSKTKQNSKNKKAAEPEQIPEILVPEPEIFTDSEEEEEAIVSAASVVAYGECIGVENINEEIAASLAEDVTYRLREVIRNCAILLKNTKQKKLLVSHLNDVLEVYEAPPLYGHAYFHESNFIYVPAAGVFVPQEHTVSLVPLATSKTPISQPKEPSIEGSWIQPETSKKISEVELTSDSEEMCEKSPPLVADVGHEPFIVKNEEKFSARSESRLPPHAQKYCIHVAKVILKCHEPHLDVVIKDIRKNPRVSAVSPYLLNLVTLSVNALDRRATLTYALLRVVEALVQNPYVNPSYSHSVKRAVNALLVIAIEPNIMPNCDDLILRKRASLLLRNVLQSWLVDLKQQNDIIKILEGVLCPNISLASHYGALILLTVLGYCTKVFFFYTILKRYLPLLLDIEAKAVSDDAIQVNHIKGALLLAAESMYRQDLNAELSAEELKCWKKIDEILYAYFGDTICLRRLYCPLMAIPSDQSVFPINKPYLDGEHLPTKESKPTSSSDTSFFKDAVTPSSKMLARRYKPVSTFLAQWPMKRKNHLPERIFENFKRLNPFRSQFYFNFIGSSQIPYERIKARKLSLSHPIFNPAKLRSNKIVGKETRKIKFCTPTYKKSSCGDLYINI
nr:PREDICTED: TAF6-like RNA polymerase II p300/CBP-associated factor-associated factor 65 kDa subunit 6L [Bemisia tabaci]